MSEVERFEQLRNLIVMAVADGSFSEEEVGFLTDRCVEWGLSEDDFRRALTDALNDDAALQLPREPAEQEELLTDLVRMMAADGRLHESEKRLFALAAAKMGVNDLRIDALIDRLVK